jgi:riboflavin synthase
MFTGIITNTGKITKWKPAANGGRLGVKAKRKYPGVKIGESIAINGCCLTVIGQKNGVIDFDISDETVRKTAFLDYGPNKKVNLERAMKASDALGGHFVLGHVDGVGKIKAVTINPGSIEYTVQFPKKFAHLLIDKGSVSVDGISLTVCNLKKTTFDLYIIPHTLKETIMPDYHVGKKVNLEFDVLGKYVARFKEIEK